MYRKLFIKLILLCLSIYFVYTDENYSYLRSVPEKYQSFIVKIDKRYDFPMEYFLSIITTESFWDEKRISPMNTNGSYDKGLGQLNSYCIPDFKWKYWRRNEKFDPLNGIHNLEVASAHFNVLFRYFDKNIEKAVKAYNVGIGSMERNERQEKAEEYWTKIKINLKFFSSFTAECLY